MKKQNRFKNRIVGYRIAKASELKANPLNWRTHPPHQEEEMESILDTVGWVGIIIHNIRTGHVIDGHLRDKIALAHDDEEVPILDVDISEEEEKLVLASFDPISALAEPDYEILNQLLADIEADMPLLDDLLAETELAMDILDMSSGGGSSDSTRNIERKAQNVRVVLAVEDVLIFEGAMASTGLINRSEALMEICKAYLDEKG